MALNGRLESIPLAEVLRMLARAKKSGCLRVEASTLEGRIYLRDGLLMYASTRRDDDLRADLLNAGYVHAEDWLSVERREKVIADVLVEGTSEADLRDFLTEQGTEVIFRLNRPGRGTFDFGDDVVPRYDAGELIDIEVCLAEAEHRAAQWAEIEEVIPGTKFRLRMAPELPGQARDVTLSSDTWRLLAAMGKQGTVEEVAQGVGATDFTVARAMASMVRQGLVELAENPNARETYNDAHLDDAHLDGAHVDGAHVDGAHVDGAPLEESEYELEAPVTEDEAAPVDDEDELLASLLSGMGASDLEEGDGDDLEILRASYDANGDLGGSLSERAAELSRRRGIGAAIRNELDDRE